MKFKIFISTLILLVVIVMFLLKIYKPQTQVGINKTEPKFRVSTEELITYFNLDEELGDKKFSNKILQVKGIIADISTIKGKSIITLKEESNKASVICHLKPKEQNKLLKYKKNNLIVIKGKCTGFLLDVMMINCVIID